MARRGRKPDLQRRQQMAKLRRQGLTIGEIAAEFGCSTQNVSATLSAQGAQQHFPLTCSQCRRVLRRGHSSLSRNRRVLCLPCLRKQPSPSFAERLKTYRIRAGLTQQELARRAGLEPTTVAWYEHGRRPPPWRTLAKLVRVLGADLLLVPPV
jgi:DNA-binding XRE family transcriptional regulator